MIRILANLTQEQADTFALVLASAGIASHIRGEALACELWVEEAHAPEALGLIRDYREENRPQRLPGRPRMLREYGRTTAGLWGALILLACYLAVVRGGGLNAYSRVYGAASGLIQQGQLYRCATALLLHADAVHLAGNLLGIAVFATAVCSVAGWGVGWLMILATGIAGNLANAYFYSAGHLSIGASTAVFGAVGILSALQLVRRIVRPGERFKAFLPLAAGLALLAMLGASENADLTAHLFGFFCGLLLGGLYGLQARRPAGPFVQAGALLAVTAAVSRRRSHRRRPALGYPCPRPGLLRARTGRRLPGAGGKLHGRLVGLPGPGSLFRPHPACRTGQESPPVPRCPVGRGAGAADEPATPFAGFRHRQTPLRPGQ